MCNCIMKMYIYYSTHTRPWKIDPGKNTSNLAKKSNKFIFQKLYFFYFVIQFCPLAFIPIERAFETFFKMGSQQRIFKSLHCHMQEFQIG